MFNISPNKIITVTRGDSFEFNLTVSMSDPMLQTNMGWMTEDDEVLLSVMEPHQRFEHGIIRKRKIYTKEDVEPETIDDDGVTPNPEAGELYITFMPEDTENLLPGLYYYEIKIRTAIRDDNDNITGYDMATVLPKTKFIIVE